MSAYFENVRADLSAGYSFMIGQRATLITGFIEFVKSMHRATSCTMNLSFACTK